MSDEKTTHFQFNLEGIELEISGERDFVEMMYRRIMRDIEDARTLPAADSQEALSRETEKLPAIKRSDKADKKGKKRPVIWVHRCSEMMHKIYMSSPEDVKRSPLFRAIDTSWLSVVFANDDNVTHVMASIEEGHTLWAELTDAGRAKIKNAKAE